MLDSSPTGGGGLVVGGGDELWILNCLESLRKNKGTCIKFFCINKVIRERYKDMQEVPPPSHKF